MKKFWKTILSVMLGVGILCSSISAQSLNEAEGFEYPDFRSEEWADELDQNVKVEACQIPEDVLEELTTEELLELVLKYPFIFEMYVYDNEQIGFESVYEDFNGLRELFAREDVAQVLLKQYASLEVANSLEETDLEEVSDLVYQLAYIEILLMQENILEQLNEVELQIVEQELEDKYMQKCENPDIYSLTAETGYKILGIQGLQTYSEYPDIIKEGYVYTPNGSAVYVYEFADLTEVEIVKVDEFMAQYPNVTILSEKTSKYNCHSYAWYNQSTNNTWWMDDPMAYMTDGSYTQESQAVVGAKIFYSTPGYKHSGIVSELGRQGYNCYVTSKWGVCPLVYHFYTDCPYWDSNYYISFWSR